MTLVEAWFKTWQAYRAGLITEQQCRKQTDEIEHQMTAEELEYLNCIIDIRE